jgi:hypothetical protein
MHTSQSTKWPHQLLRTITVEFHFNVKLFHQKQFYATGSLAISLEVRKYFFEAREQTTVAYLKHRLDIKK